ncbi:MAG TPA: aspartate--tRNA(Asn) ligase [Egibacteraceae bacterium]|nr:aspartate--tRNA(Asn) ligase [Egibacteraceae bacterium]
MEGPHLPRTLVVDVGRNLGQLVRVCGWVQEVRASEDPQVVVLRDHTGLVRLVSRGGLLGDVIGALAPESAVQASGKVDATPAGGVHVALENLDVVGPALASAPLSEASTLEERLDWRFLDLRHPRNRLIFAVQTTAERAMRAFWYEHGFTELHSPKLKPIPNKSGTHLFAVDYFGRRAYLAQSPQFYKQMAMAAGFDRVFEIGPVFRAQPDATTRHDTEFTSVDIEMSWIRSHEDLLVLEEDLLCRVLAAVGEEHGEQLARWFGVEVSVPRVPFPRVTIDEAKKIVEATDWPVGGENDDLDAEGERRLARHVAGEHGHEFVFVVDYPELSRPFYHMRCHERSVATRSFDLLWKGLEITSGAQREHRYGRLVAQARSRGVPVEVIGQYLDFFKFGCPPHGGFGLGLTRMLMSMLGVGDVREVTYLFRGPDRLTP